jgi:hypothetical protein
MMMRPRPQWWPYAVLFAEVLVFYRRVLFDFSYVIPWDLRYYHFPMLAFVARSLRAGELPLWDPYSYCGFPIYANLTAQLFYPPTLVILFLSNWLAPRHLLYFVELQLIGHVLLAGVFTYWLLKRLGLTAVAATTGATVYQLGAFFASQAQHLGAIDAAAWLPLALWSIVSLASEPRLRYLAVLAFSLAMSILSGYPAVTAVVFAGAFALAVLYIAFRLARPKLLLYVLGAVIWSVALSSIQMLPTLELTRLSVAKFRTSFLGTGGGMWPQALVSLVLPNHYSLFDLSHYSQSPNPTFMYTYCGIVGLALAIMGITRRSRLSGVFAVLTIIGAFAMLGDHTPAGRAVLLMLPRVVRGSIYPEFALALFTIGMAVLAGLGAQKTGRGLLALVVLAATAADLIAVGSSRPMNTASTKLEAGVTHEYFDGSRELLERVRGLVNQNVPPWRMDTIKDSMFWSSTQALVEVPSANGNDPFALERYIAVRISFVANGVRWGRYYEVADPDSPLLSLLNVRYLLSRAPFNDPRRPKIADVPAGAVYENPDVLPRFFLVNRIERAGGLEQSVSVMRSAQFRPGEFAAVEGAPVFEQQENVAGDPPVRVLHYAPREIVLETAAGHPAFLVTSESYYPGWHAYVDGREQPLYVTNTAFRGMALPAGTHRIEMRFNPPILWRGAFISAVALALLLLVAASAIIIRRPWTS